ncbi:hypothetical protein [Pseudomonas sp. BIGb0164]|uniref:hypothetical protein n=1 Tax=Pseudomonas sp. BIGb0164 TaxID=2940605 RepID=UPI00216A1760|nr:hypothetical protein [Pseudomonas sp. BIGb0164]MCS4250642.1 hypothetical protein [Pseudomonas sp. BIGb0164]
MTNQAQIDALEHLLMAVLRSNEMKASAYSVFEEAHLAIMNSKERGDPHQKVAAVNYLFHLKDKF